MGFKLRGGEISDFEKTRFRGLSPLQKSSEIQREKRKRHSYGFRTNAAMHITLLILTHFRSLTASGTRRRGNSSSLCFTHFAMCWALKNCMKFTGIDGYSLLIPTISRAEVNLSEIRVGLDVCMEGNGSSGEE